ncbi:hypothetical protein UFOVP1502_15 [uncultured Caudovirales phage]|uniref:Uncharacterized protein n=1 Tax=uncultured Caudovirales phage TaxID=2100421 RepID=A0A6J5SR01_9CAUD|nr:hypothetical protein UFOVP1502_15 [uncultured Caudovirales phage]
MSDIAQANVPASRVTLLASGARTTTASATAIPGFAAAAKLVMQLDVTVASGTTPTLDVVVQDTVDGTNYNTIATFTQATGVTREVIRLTTAFTDSLRVSYTIGGVTPSFTFAVITWADSV